MEKGEGGDFPPKKAQSDKPVSVAAQSDFPAKKLARQLDFTGFGGASAAVMLPEHPQQLAAQPLPPRPQANTATPMQPPAPQPESHSQQHLLLMPMQSQSPIPSIRPV
ncbi:hypothetical protein U1Q18_018166 [Sarracenia purpurea var. burkii]